MRRHRERGFALVLVLWGVSLLALIAVMQSGGAKTGATIARQLVATTTDEQVAATVVVIASTDLLRPLKERQWPVDGVQVNLSLSGRRITARLIAEDGKVSINESSAETLAKLFAASQSQLDPDELAKAVLRGPPNRIEADQQAEPSFSSSSVAHRARYASIEELRAVPGMTASLFRSICSLVTVDSTRSFPNQRTMPGELRPILLRTETGPDYAASAADDTAASAQASTLARTTGVSRNEAQFQSPAYSLTVAIADQGHQNPAIFRTTFRLSLNSAAPPVEVLRPLRQIYEEDCRSYLFR